MISDLPVHTTIPAADLDRAMRWYQEKLGFEPVQKLEGATLYEDVDGGRFILYATPNAGQAPQTVMGFTTSAIEADVADLKGRGVTFEEYDFPGLKTVESIATAGPRKAAWFRDSENNILGIVEYLD
jgi:catechol 2,3-dioxygenase-like lactoylglutathione lyase family enzyme